MSKMVTNHPHMSFSVIHWVEKSSRHTKAGVVDLNLGIYGQSHPLYQSDVSISMYNCLPHISTFVSISPTSIQSLQYVLPVNGLKF